MLVKNVVWVEMKWIRQKVRRPTMSERRIFLTMASSIKGLALSVCSGVMCPQKLWVLSYRDKDTIPHNP